MSMYINERRLLFRVSGLCFVVVYLVGRFDWKIGKHNGRTKGSEYSRETQLEQNRSLLRTTSRGEKNVSVCIVASAFCLASPFVRLLLFEDSQNLRCLCKLYEKEKRNTDFCVRVVRRTHERWKEVCAVYGFSRLSLPNESLLSERSTVKASARNERVFRERSKLETKLAGSAIWRRNSKLRPKFVWCFTDVRYSEMRKSTRIKITCMYVCETIICFRIIKEKKTKPMMCWFTCFRWLNRRYLPQWLHLQVMRCARSKPANRT